MSLRLVLFISLIKSLISIVHFAPCALLQSTWMKESFRAISPNLESQMDREDYGSSSSAPSSPRSPRAKRKRAFSPEKFDAATELQFDDCSDSGDDF